jgi:hypothetical protein
MNQVGTDDQGDHLVQEGTIEILRMAGMIEWHAANKNLEDFQGKRNPNVGCMAWVRCSGM